MQGGYYSATGPSYHGDDLPLSPPFPKRGPHTIPPPRLPRHHQPYVSFGGSLGGFSLSTLGRSAASVLAAQYPSDPYSLTMGYTQRPALMAGLAPNCSVHNPPPDPLSAHGNETGRTARTQADWRDFCRQRAGESKALHCVRIV